MMTQQPHGNGGMPHDPSHLNQLLQKGIDAHRQHRLDDARKIYELILQMNPSHPQAAHYLGLIEREQNQLSHACELFEIALTGTPDDAALHYNLALTQQQLGHRESAIKHYHRATTLQPNFPQAYNNLGVILQECGLQEEAAKQFRTALKYDPRRAETYFNLSRSIRYHEENDDIVRIQGLLKQNQLSQSETSKLHFALGKIFDDLKKYDIAFEHYRQANLHSPAYFDPDTFRGFIDDLCATFSKDFFEHHRYFGNSDRRPTFIVGIPRSGTTLVEQILSSHSKIYGAGELDYFNTIAAAIPRITGTSSLREAYAQFDRNLSYQIARNYIHNINQLAPSAEIFIDKAPLNFLHLGLITLVFPKARIIHVKRDPVDTCLSCYFQNFNEQHAYAADLNSLASVYEQYQKLQQHWQQHLPNTIYTVEYENLVGDTELESRKLIQFLELDWESNCLDYHRQLRRVSTASSWQARQPVYKRSVARWRHYEKHLQPLMHLRK
ncbi:MAG: sulfotransferase [Gammaproteobacteria bacterium]|nr:sulfotransferase [Gammaproteobacteria bacterium]